MPVVPLASGVQIRPSSRHYSRAAIIDVVLFSATNSAFHFCRQMRPTQYSFKWASGWEVRARGIFISMRRSEARPARSLVKLVLLSQAMNIAIN